MLGLVVLGLIFAFAAVMGWHELRGPRVEAPHPTPRTRADRVEAGLRAAGYADDEVAYALADIEPEVVRVRTNRAGPLIVVSAPEFAVRAVAFSVDAAERRARDRVARRAGVEARAILFDELD